MSRSLFSLALCSSLTTAAWAQTTPPSEPGSGAATPPALEPARPPEPATAPPPNDPPRVAPPPAQPPLPPPRVGRRVDIETPPKAPTPPRGARVHAGFFARVATGFGVYEESLFTNDAEEYGGDVEGRTMGIASLGELSIGGTIARGLVLGGAAYTAQLFNGNFRLDDESDGSPPSELDPELRTLAVIGPFIDWYPKPTKGLHLQAALGFAAMTNSAGGSRSFEEPDYRAAGGGLVLGGGYEWFVADEWSIGVMGRLMAAVVTGRDDADVRWVHGITTTPSLLVGVTYH